MKQAEKASKDFIELKVNILSEREFDFFVVAPVVYVGVESGVVACIAVLDSQLGDGDVASARLGVHLLGDVDIELLGFAVGKHYLEVFSEFEINLIYKDSSRTVINRQ